MVASLLLATTVAPGYAQAALNATLKLKGAKQGDVKGSVTQKGREGGIKVIAVQHEIVSPRDPASGIATGKRMHRPFVVTVEVDRATPLLLNAVTKGETFSTFSLEVAGPKGDAALYRVNLSNASISGFEFVTLTDKDTAALKLTVTYQKIEWVWIEGNVTAQDDWETPAASKKL